MPRPPSPMLEVGLRALLPVLVGIAICVAAGVAVWFVVSRVRERTARTGALRSFADAVADEANERAERAAARVLRCNDHQARPPLPPRSGGSGA